MRRKQRQTPEQKAKAQEDLRYKAATLLDLAASKAGRGPRTRGAVRRVAEWLDLGKPYRRLFQDMAWLGTVSREDTP